MDSHSAQIIFLIISFLIVLSVLGFVTFMLIKMYQKNSFVVKEEQDVEGNAAHYHCPRCNGQMERGFAMAGRGILYAEEHGKSISVFATVFSVLDNTMSISLPPAQNRAWYCRPCKYILLDHSKLIKRNKK